MIRKGLVKMLMDDYGMSMEQALDTVYGSNTYKKIERPSTGLYYQGAVYAMDMLKKNWERPDNVLKTDQFTDFSTLPSRGYRLQVQAKRHFPSLSCR